MVRHDLFTIDPTNKYRLTQLHAPAPDPALN